MHAIGIHLLLELNDCNRALLSDIEFLKNILLSAAQQADATIIGQSFHPFEPYGGVSGVVIIAESHLYIHTWPEYSYAAVDIFTCGNRLHPERAVDLLIRGLEAKNHSVLELKRGILDSMEPDEGE